MVIILEEEKEGPETFKSVNNSIRTSTLVSGSQKSDTLKMGGEKGKKYSKMVSIGHFNSSFSQKKYLFLAFWGHDKILSALDDNHWAKGVDLARIK